MLEELALSDYKGSDPFKEHHPLRYNSINSLLKQDGDGRNRVRHAGMYSVCLAIVIPLQRVQAERRRQRDQNKQRLEMDRKKTACVPRRLPRLAGVFLWISRSHVFSCRQLKRMNVSKDPSSSKRFALLRELLLRENQ